MRAELERDLQGRIVAMLRLGGYEVLQTTAWRQKGPSGVTPGVPDLLVGHPSIGPGVWLGLEVKTLKGKLSPAQRRLANLRMIVVVRSEREAVHAAYKWLKGSFSLVLDPEGYTGALRKGSPERLLGEGVA